MRLGQLQGGEVAPGEAGAGLGDAEVAKVGHSTTFGTAK